MNSGLISAPPHLSARFESIDAAAAVQDWDLQFVQLEPGPIAIQADFWALPSITWARYAWNRAFHQQGEAPAAGATFGWMHGSSVSKWNGREIGADHLLCFNGRNGFDCVSDDDFNATTITVEPARLLETGLALGLEIHPDFTRGATTPFPCEPDKLRRLIRTVTAAEARLCRRAPSPDLAHAGKAQGDRIYAALARLLGREPPRLLTRPGNRRRVLGRALDVIDAHAREAISVAELCRLSATSERTLDRAFRDEFGLSPKRYLQRIRLQGARRQLLRAEPDNRVRDVALDWGFWHMSQFARDYRREFGELPSETLGATSRS